MPTPLADLIVLGSIIFFAFQGMSNGLFSAMYQTVQFLVPLTLALALFDKLSQLAMLTTCPADWSVFAAFGLVLLGGIVAIRQAGAACIPEDGISTFKMLDKLGGLLVAALAGGALAGGVLVLWSMCPFAVQLKVDATALKVDMGSQALVRFAALAESVGTDKAFVLEGEKIAKATDKNALPLVEEPYCDANGNSMHDDKEPFVDLNRDRKFTKDVYYLDANGNKKWDPGILDKYILGRWAEAVPEPAALPAASSTEKTDDKPDAKAAQ